jgi:phage gpG-like protein
MTAAQLAEKMAVLVAAAEATAHLGETLMAETVKTHIKDVYGDSGKLQDLADSTQEERARLGYSPNDPLVRTGQLLRDSIKIAYDPKGFAVGSEEPVAAFQEFGTGHIPPRPAIAIGASEAMPEVREIMVATAKAVLGFPLDLEALRARHSSAVVSP